MSQRSRKKRQSRRLWLQAARTCFIRDGYEGSSVAAIAAEAGLSRAGFFLYFGAKQAVRQALRLEALQALTMMASQEAERGSGASQLLHALQRMQQYMLAEDAHLQAISLLAAGLTASEQDEAAAWQRLAEYLGRLAGQGRLDDARAHMAAGVLRGGWQARADAALIAGALAAVYQG